MKIYLILMMAGCLAGFGEDLVTVLSADPQENVLLEVSCDGPRRLEMSADLDEWKPVVSFLPMLDRFRLEAPQYTRKVTYYRLVDISSDPRVFDTSDSLPEIAGRRLGNFVFSVSFDDEGSGMLNNGYVNAVQNHTYEVVDRQAGIISLRLAIPDGSRNALTLVFAKDPLEDSINEIAAYSLVQRFGDFYSYSDTTFEPVIQAAENGSWGMLWEQTYLPTPAIPPLDVIGGTLWLNRELSDQVSIEILSPTEGRWVEASRSEMVALEFYRTGVSTHTCIMTRADGSKILAETNEGDFREGFLGRAWELPNDGSSYPCPGEPFYSCGTYRTSDLTLPESD